LLSSDTLANNFSVFIDPDVGFSRSSGAGEETSNGFGKHSQKRFIKESLDIILNCMRSHDTLNKNH